MRLYVGSTNPVKINAVTIASSETWPDAIVQGLSVESGISEQPMSDEETRLGAQNRAKACMKIALAESDSEDTILAVGLEGGVFRFHDELWSTVWVVVADAHLDLFESNGARFKIPDQIAQPILSGREMGPVVGEIFGDMNTKKKNGAIGVITNNFIDRTEEYSIIAKMALGLYHGKNWYDDLQIAKK